MTELTAAPNETQTLAQLADEAKARDTVELFDGRVYGVITAPGQQLHQLDLEKYEATPARKLGTVTLADADSFVTYVDRHSQVRGTTQWADIDAGRIIAVLDDHASHVDDQKDGSPGWGQHRAVLTLKQTPDWKHWIESDGRFLDQATFAEHIEDGVDAIRDPDAATMLEVAQTFHAKRGVNFASTKRLGGEVEFAYEETVQARAGQKGKFEVPELLTLGLVPFEGSDPYEVKARIRFRLSDGNLSIGYRLIRPDKVRRSAFDDVVAKVAGGSGLPVMAGTPRS